MRSEPLTKCCEPLRKMRLRLGACKIDLSPQVVLLISFQDDSSVVVPFVLCFGVEIVCGLNLLYVFVFLFKFG